VIVVDTSVWVAALRKAASAEASALQRLLDADEVALAAPVRVELLIGASRKDRSALRRVLSALPLFVPADSTWDLLDAWVDRAGDAGQRFGVIDLLIGALSAERGATVWSLDADFARMERLALVTRFLP
jgi:predicted nucleic acid-binding protein